MGPPDWPMPEETLQICLQMWSEDDGPYEGKHYRLGRTLNVPQPIRRPPILAQLCGLAALGVGEVHSWVPRSSDGGCDPLRTGLPSDR